MMNTGDQHSDAEISSNPSRSNSGGGGAAVSPSINHPSALLLRNDDALDTTLNLCDLSSISRLAQTCRHLSAFVSDPNQIFWRAHLIDVLGVPSGEVGNVKLAADTSAKILLKAAVDARLTNNNNTTGVTVGGADEEWEYRHDSNERTISAETTGWNTHQIDYVVDDASTTYAAGHDFAVRYRMPVPEAPSTVIRRRGDGSNVLDVAISSVSYYEVRLIGRGRQQQQRRSRPAADDEGDNLPQQAACVAVGFSTKSFALSRYQPGWTENSIGYHCDDGQIFFASGTEGVSFGPTYGDGDTIGCGIHIPSGSVFLTKNGSLIGTALVISDDPKTYRHIFPTIGIDSAMFSIHTNFGSQPFSFDVSTAEKLYEAYPPPARRSRRLNDASSDADGTSSPATILEQNGLICEHEEAQTFHPWNAATSTRRIFIQETDWTTIDSLVAFEDAVEMDYNSYDDSSFGSADSLHGDDSDGE